MKYHFDENGRLIRVYNDINSRFILEDMFAKLKINYSKKWICNVLVLFNNEEESLYDDEDMTKITIGSSERN